jgi:plasmid maintenance system killer protein
VHHRWDLIFPSKTAPPGNRLERLAGDRKGQHGIRINDQWRICLRWRDGDAHEVEIVDYHRGELNDGRLSSSASR